MKCKEIYRCNILFELEDNFSIDIEKQDGKTVLVIDNEDSRNSVLNTYLNYWYDKKQVFSLDKYSDAKDPRVIDYRSWRGRFGSNEFLFENEVLQNISDAYQTKLDKLTKSKTKHCETISDLVRLVCSISPDLLIGTDDEITNLQNPIKSYALFLTQSSLQSLVMYLKPLPSSYMSFITLGSKTTSVTHLSSTQDQF